MMNTPLIALLVLLLVGCGTNNETTQPQEQSIVQAVYASGRIYPTKYYKVAAKYPGTVAEIFVQSGDSVRAGMALIRIRNVSADLAVQSAQNTYQLAEDNANESGAYLSAASAEYQAAQEKYLYDSSMATKQQRLYAAKATSQSTYDAASTQADISRQQMTKAYQTYKNLLRRAQLERQNAKLQLESQRSNRDDFIIYAVEDGVVYDVAPNLGELVSPQMVLLEIGEAAQYEVELSIDETDIALVHLGQRVVYTVDAMKSERFEGLITHINPRVSATDKTAKVTATINSRPALRFLPGMSLEANIIVAEKKKALTIPRDFLKPGPAVRVERGSDIETVSVTTGIEDLRFIEVTRGLQPGDVIVK